MCMEDHVAILQISKIEMSLRNATEVAWTLVELACIVCRGMASATQQAVLMQEVIHLEVCCTAAG